MPNTIQDLIDLQEADIVVTKLPIESEPNLMSKAFALLEYGNATVPAARQILRSTISAVVTEEYSSHDDLDGDALQFAVLRSVENFLSTAYKGDNDTGSQTRYTDFLPVGNPVSTVRRHGGITASAYREARANWEAGHPDLPEDLRPIVASAFSTEPGSVQHLHATARVRAVRPGLIPADVLSKL